MVEKFEDKNTKDPSSTSKWNFERSLLATNNICRCGEMVDAVDSKSTLGNKVLVRVRSSALLKFFDFKERNYENNSY